MTGGWLTWRKAGVRERQWSLRHFVADNGSRSLCGVPVHWDRVGDGSAKRCPRCHALKKKDSAPKVYDDHWVYKCFASDGRLLYVGITWMALGRHGGHRRDTEWAREIHNIEIEHFATREQAADRERELIRTLRPEHNRLGAVPDLADDEWTVAEIAEWIAMSPRWVRGQIEAGLMQAEARPLGEKRTVYVVSRANLAAYMGFDVPFPRKTSTATSAAHA